MTKMLFVEDDDVIKAIWADGSDQPFRESHGPGRPQLSTSPSANACST
jgi:hypothetical protein